MACPATRVGKRFASLRDKFPIVACGVKSEFQNSERICLSRFAVRFGTCEAAMLILASGSDHELPNAVLRIKFSRRVLWSETLIVVVVPVDHDFRTGRIERVP